MINHDKIKLGVLGAGVMGSGVTQLFAEYGFNVTVMDTVGSQLDKAANKIAERLRHKAILEQKLSLKEREEILSRISYTQDMADLSHADIVIENITENWQLKKAVYLSMNEICSPKCIFGVNTSAISITEIASLVKNPERVIGLHFMNPVPMMPLVEVIKGYHTSSQTIEYIRIVLEKAARKMITVNDSVGFVTNRAMMIFVNEAIFMVQENVASIEDIDTLFRQCFGHKMGPLQTADLIGLDTILYSLNVLYEGLNDPKYRPCWLLKKMVAAGLHGEKSKKGFYEYA